MSKSKKNKSKGNNLKQYGTLLPSGNSDTFDDIRRQLRSRRITWYERALKSGGVIFWMYESELHKLPADESEPIKEYLPVDDKSGHSIYLVNSMLRDKDFSGNDGKDIMYN